MSGSVSGVTGTTGVGSTAMPGGLTPEGIMAYCAMQLGTYDEEIKGKMDKQTQMKDAQAALTQVKTDLAKDHIDGNMSPADKAKILADIKKAYDALPPEESAGRADLDALFKRLASTMCNNDQPVGESLATLTPDQITKLSNMGDINRDGAANYVANEELKNMSIPVDNLLSNISRGGEMAMIEIQSAVSRRQQAVQFATNMMSKYNEGIQSVVSNLGK